MQDRPFRVAAIAGAALFMAWHAVAVAVGPYPDSEIRQRLLPIFEPYLRAGYLDHRWMFFGPRPDAGRLIRYEVTRADGAVDEFALSEAVDRASPSYLRWMRLFDRIAEDAGLQQSAAAFLCRRHGDPPPRAVRLVVLHQLTISPELYRSGVRPGDREALWREPGPEMACHADRAEDRVE